MVLTAAKGGNTCVQLLDMPRNTTSILLNSVNGHRFPLGIVILIKGVK